MNNSSTGYTIIHRELIRIQEGKMLLQYFLSAIALGFLVAIPPGAVTVIACQRALQYGFRNSMIFILGGRISDAFYFTLVYIGVANLISRNPYFRIALWFISAAILLTLGIISLISLKNNKQDSDMHIQSRPLATFVSGIIITLSNPVTIVSWIAVGGNFLLIWRNKLPESGDYGIITILSVVAGVFLWFIPLTYIVSRLKKIINNKAGKWMIAIANAFLVIFGLTALYYALITLSEYIW